MLRFLLAAPLIVHGLAHLSGFLASWTANDGGFTDRPWIISTSISVHDPVGRMFGILWLIAMIGFVGSGVGLVLRQAWWPTLAMAAVLLSLLVIVPWWHSVPPGAKIGAAFDLLVLAVLLLPLRESVLEIAR